jgi:hypothetical protein
MPVTSDLRANCFARRCAIAGRLQAGAPDCSTVPWIAPRNGASAAGTGGTARRCTAFVVQFALNAARRAVLGDDVWARVIAENPNRVW